ncbi:response regulator transcription factor [Shouchella patagoniensis]|uniref:response regulator transcription factor n=1 Tax=Shouchella patagoniensis TaxID=228576 RepID=UPI000994A62F|nr:response regulator transcription factor [Shouchella patagoniensis]
MINIFIAEDQVILRDALTSLLDMENDIEVIGTAGSGKAVLDFSKLHDVDLLLMDIEMPDGTGLETAAALQQQGFEGKIALLTTFSRAGYIEKAMTIGVNGYLLKDEPIEELIKAIRRIINGKKAISPMLGDLLFNLKSNPLSEREQDIMRRVQQGKSTEQIAREAHLTLGTVRNYVSSAMQKLETTNRYEAVQLAEEKGWL